MREYVNKKEKQHLTTKISHITICVWLSKTATKNNMLLIDPILINKMKMIWYFASRT